MEYQSFDKEIEKHLADFSQIWRDHGHELRITLEKLGAERDAAMKEIQDSAADQEKKINELKSRRHALIQKIKEEKELSKQKESSRKEQNLLLDRCLRKKERIEDLETGNLALLQKYSEALKTAREETKKLNETVVLPVNVMKEYLGMDL